MSKNWKFPISATAAVMVLSVALPITSAYAQNVPQNVIDTAQQSCIENAQSNGFELGEVVSAGPSDRTDKDAKIVLNLTRDGQLFRQTCYYSEASGVELGDDTANAVAGVAPDLSRLWWLLLPLLGLPLLLAWARRRDAAAPPIVVTDRGRYAGRSEAVVRNNGRSIEVHSGPDNSYRVTKTLYDGQRVGLTGNYQNDWAELAEGGWISTHHLESNPRFVNR